MPAADAGRWIKLTQGLGDRMSLGVFLAVLVAALLHATWNALVKVSADRLVLLVVLKLGTTLFALSSVPFIEMPPVEVWPYILTSTAIHTGYFMFLAVAYRYGDLSHVYPLSRGAAPLIVAVLATIFLDEVLDTQAALAVLLVGLGIMSLVFTKGADGLRQPRAMGAALATACFIAGYTLVDGTGARLSANAHSYILWLNVFSGIPIILYVLVFRRRQFHAQAHKVWRAGVLSGAVSLLAYWIVLWAATQAPLAMVAAVREASMVFAVIFGVVFLKERLDLRRLLSVFVTITGTVLLKTSR